MDDMGQTYLAEDDAEANEARTLRPLQAAAGTPGHPDRLRAARGAVGR